MKTLLTILAVCLGLSAEAALPPVLRNIWDTNAAPDTNTILFGPSLKSLTGLTWLFDFGGTANFPRTVSMSSNLSVGSRVSLQSFSVTPTYTNSSVSQTNFIAAFGQQETSCTLQTNWLALVCSTNRSSNSVTWANWTVFNYLGSNATITLNSSWLALGACTNFFTLTNGKALRLSIQFTGKNNPGWDSETNVLYGYSFQP